MEIVKQIDDLTIERFKFIDINNNLYLDIYSLEKRESTKHRKYTKIKKYDRLMERVSNMEESDVPLTDDIKDEAFRMFISKIKVLKWSER